MGMKEDAWAKFDEFIRNDGGLIKELPVGDGHNYAIFSDLHIGDGTRADNFRQNAEVFLKALEHYKSRGFSLILLGDIEEFHQFDLTRILAKYDQTVYAFIRTHFQGTTFRVVGNHDIDWIWRDPIKEAELITATAAVKLGRNILCAHGHQAVEDYEKDLHVVRLGTTIWRIVETLFSFKDPSTVTQLPGKKDKIYADWAKERKKILICGHTHVPIWMGKSMYDWAGQEIKAIAKRLTAKRTRSKTDQYEVQKLRSRKDWLQTKRNYVEEELRKSKTRGAAVTRAKAEALSPYYFNSGGGLFGDGITNLEIEGSKLRLIYWPRETKEREPIWNDFELTSIIEDV
jgi:UDP-2,3-diacylglucosamine pyrophosphatase LpxH